MAPVALSELTSKTRRLVCIGALLTVIAIAVDPTMQQAITVDVRQEYDPRPARLPRSQSFFDIAMQGTQDHFFWVPTTSMVSYIFTGMFYQ